MYNILEFNFHPGTTKFDAHGRSPTTSSLSKNDRTWKKATTQLSSHFHFYNNRSYGVSGHRRSPDPCHISGHCSSPSHSHGSKAGPWETPCSFQPWGRASFQAICIISWNSISIQELQSLMHMVVNQPPPPCPKTTGAGKKRQLNCLLTFAFTTTGVMGFLVIVAHCSSPDHSHGSKAGSWETPCSFQPLGRASFI